MCIYVYIYIYIYIYVYGSSPRLLRSPRAGPSRASDSALRSALRPSTVIICCIPIYSIQDATPSQAVPMVSASCQTPRNAEIKNAHNKQCSCSYCKLMMLKL